MAGHDVAHAGHAPKIAEKTPTKTYGKLFEITTTKKGSILFAERHNNAVSALTAAHRRQSMKSASLQAQVGGKDSDAAFKLFRKQRNIQGGDIPYPTEEQRQNYHLLDDNTIYNMALPSEGIMLPYTKEKLIQREKYNSPLVYECFCTLSDDEKFEREYIKTIN